MDVFEALEKRKSVRWYKDQPVEMEKLEKILAFGNKAPIAGAIHLSVIQNKDLLQKINDTAAGVMRNSDNEFLKSRISTPGYEPLYGAPVLVLVSGPKGGRGNLANAACAVMNMIMAATGLGLGSCYVMSPIMAMKQGPFEKEAGLPEDYEAVVGLLLGYEAGDRFARERKTPDNINFVD